MSLFPIHSQQPAEASSQPLESFSFNVPGLEKQVREDTEEDIAQRSMFFQPVLFTKSPGLVYTLAYFAKEEFNNTMTGSRRGQASEDCRPVVV